MRAIARRPMPAENDSNFSSLNSHIHIHTHTRRWKTIRLVEEMVRWCKPELKNKFTTSWALTRWHLLGMVALACPTTSFSLASSSVVFICLSVFLNNDKQMQCVSNIIVFSSFCTLYRLPNVVQMDSVDTRIHYYLKVFPHVVGIQIQPLCAGSFIWAGWAVVHCCIVK